MFSHSLITLIDFFIVSESTFRMYIPAFTSEKGTFSDLE